MIRHVKVMQAKARLCRVEKIGGAVDQYAVRSPTGKMYAVTEMVYRGSDFEAVCTCDWSQYHPDRMCSHKMAALEFKLGRRVSFWRTLGDAMRQHRKRLSTQDVWATVR
jgi:hypothetical protein